MNQSVPQGTNSYNRLTQWDLLRSLCMFAVIIVHSGGHLGTLIGINAGSIASTAAILCDPIFFALSGYFAIRPLKGSLASYYSRKVSTIVLPLIVYSLVLYLYTTKLDGLSLFGYMTFFYNQLSPWWFIPALIPFLAIAPFLNWLFEKLDDEQVKLIAKVFCIVTLWGIAFNFLCWLFRTTQHPTLEHAVMVFESFLPTVLIPGSGYFMYFCLGYFFRRLAPITPESTRKRLILAGLALWVLDVIFVYFGIDRFDPSYSWLFATIAMMFIFDRIRITNPTAQRAIEWTARRSYSIYLLQYTAIALAAPFVYETLLNGEIGSFIAPIRLLVWIAMVAGAYLISLAAASVIDTTLLRGAQAIYNKAASSLLKSSQERVAS